MSRRTFSEEEIKVIAVEAVEGQLPPFPLPSFPKENNLYVLQLFIWEGKAYYVWCPHRRFSAETQSLCEEITGKKTPPLYPQNPNN